MAIADLRGELERDDPAHRLCMLVTPQTQNRRLATIYGGGTLGDHARGEFALFDAAQVRAIVACLWWKLDAAGYDPAIEQMLEHNWLEREAGLV